MVYIMYMYVNKRVELAQRGIALQKIYVLLILVLLLLLLLLLLSEVLSAKVLHRVGRNITINSILFYFINVSYIIISWLKHQAEFDISVQFVMPQ